MNEPIGGRGRDVDDAGAYQAAHTQPPPPLEPASSRLECARPRVFSPPRSRLEQQQQQQQQQQSATPSSTPLSCPNFGLCRSRPRLSLTVWLAGGRRLAKETVRRETLEEDVRSGRAAAAERGRPA
jgi:hypothetical protein